MNKEKKKKVLVVDDEEAIRALYKTELEDAGYEVETADSGAQALEKIASFHPDLVTLDIKMPGMDGLEALGKIRQKYQSLPVILCSAYGEYKQDFTCWASDAYLVKSSNVEELIETVGRLLEKKERNDDD